MLNKPWEYCDLWDNETQFCDWLRNKFRDIWSDYPVRTNFKASMLVPVNDELREKYGLHPRTRKAGQCVYCKNLFKSTDLEVDHIKGEASFKNVLEIVSYLDHLLCEIDNMQLVCKKCHGIKTYAERYQMSFEDARLEKTVIAWCKQSPAKQKEILQLAGFEDDQISNADKRRAAARELLRPAP